MEAMTALELADLYREATQVSKLAALTDNILANSNLPPQIFFRLATIVQQVGMFDHMNRCLDAFQANASNNVPPEAWVEAARLYAQTRQMDKMLYSLDQYLAMRPGDWKAWLDRASLMLELKKTEEASESINRALNAGGQSALDIIRNDKRFAPLLQQKQQKTTDLLNLGRGR